MPTTDRELYLSVEPPPLNPKRYWSLILDFKIKQNFIYVPHCWQEYEMQHWVGWAEKTLVRGTMEENQP